MWRLFVRPMKEKLYNNLVNRNPIIFQKYKNYRRENLGVTRMKRWFYLLNLTLVYAVFKRKDHSNDLLTNYGLYQEGVESKEAKREPLEKLVKKLDAYDVISFDVFDTLLFRPVNKPSDLFFFVGERLNYLNFEEIRVKVEQKARITKKQSQGTREVTLDEIWQLMEAEAGIEKNTGIQIELEVEKFMCFANPYMVKVLQELDRRKKRIIGISDMYLSQKQIKELLVMAGIPDVLETIYVSSEYGVSKSDGALYKIVKKQMGNEKTYIHVGDNKHSDVEQAKRYGFIPYFYPNVNDVGAKYRPKDMSTIIGSLYSGVVNSYIHNGSNNYSKMYELGFIYGGHFVLGYCLWIYNYAVKQNLDKILFLSRDGDIINKVFHRLFSEEKKEVNFQYVRWSRLVGTKMCAGYYKYDYFKRFLHQKVNQGYSLKEVFSTMELSDILEDFLQKNTRYSESSQLTESNVEVVKEYLQRNWNEVLKQYKQQIDIGGQYYQEVLKGCKKVAIVDVGWAGSGAVQLNHLINKEWELNCEVVGLIAGTNAKRSDEPNASEALVFQGKLESYMFSQNHNRNLWKNHNPGGGDNLIVELLLASEEESFRHFTTDMKPYKEADFEGSKGAKDIQQGVLDFVEYYIDKVPSIPKVSGLDAYSPIGALCNNADILKKVVDNEYFTGNVE